MANKKVTNDTQELKRRAQKINNLLQGFSKSSNEASKTLSKLSGVSQEINKELQNFIVTLEGMENSEEGVNSLRQLKAANGLNLRVVTGILSHLGRLRDTKKNSVIVE